MVAVIKSGHSILRILNYNENKVKEGIARCIGEGNYPMDVDKMNFHIKLARFQKQLELNRNVTRNSVHISLNFDPSEIGIPKEKLLEIAESYMEKIGFGEQPYLVYRHDDAAHPHIHIVSIKVRADGSRIDMQNIGKNQSEKARREIEKEFGLVAADGRRAYQKYQLEPIAMGKVHYGKLQSKKALANILNGIIENYRYTSLPELNAVLGQYNVLADRGSENSRVFKAKGLVYRILNKDGKPTGVPIKASDFYNRPTLKFLEEKFNSNQAKRMPYKSRIKNTIDRALMDKTTSFDVLIRMLEQQGIHTVLRKSEAGLIYGITYIDHQTKCVFNGSALEKQYSAKAIQERCLRKEAFEPNMLTHSAQKPKGMGLQHQASAGAETNAPNYAPQGAVTSMSGSNPLDVLLQTEQATDYIPYPLKRKRKKKKRKKVHHNQ